jgi:hypothetical protein
LEKNNAHRADPLLAHPAAIATGPDRHVDRGRVQAFLGLPIDAFPDVSTTQVKIILKAPGMTPEEVETRLAVPVEQELLGILISACCAPPRNMR